MFHCLILINCELAKLLAASTQIIMSEKKDKKKKNDSNNLFNQRFFGRIKARKLMLQLTFLAVAKTNFTPTIVRIYVVLNAGKPSKNND